MMLEVSETSDVETAGKLVNVDLVKVIINLASRASRVNHVTSENHVNFTSFNAWFINQARL